jgi:hypothetical protein
MTAILLMEQAAGESMVKITMQRWQLAWQPQEQ